MQLRPHYDDPGFLTLDVALGDVGALLVGQRRRFAEELAGLSDEQWQTQSRCGAWTVRDVVVHLSSTNQFWAMSLAAGAAGAPTRFLATFDPVASPVALVTAAGDQSPAAVLADFVAGNDALAAVVADLDAATGHDDPSTENTGSESAGSESAGPDDTSPTTNEHGWDAVGEAPPGHVGLRLVALHALWDSWIHERDVLLPLGRTPTVVDDEVRASLAYAAALSPAFTHGHLSETGALVVVATDPSTRFVISVDGAGVRIGDGAAPDGSAPDRSVPDTAAVLRGDAVTLLDGLSHRGDFPAVADEHRWLVRGLFDVFDVAD